jgi:hypothetical protein
MVTLCRPFSVDEEILRFSIISEVRFEILTLLVDEDTWGFLQGIGLNQTRQTAGCH